MRAARGGGAGVGALWAVAALAVAALATAAPAGVPGAPAVAAAQSALDRTPNLTGVWTTPPGVVHFHFLHRFQRTPPPARKVLNSPTFLVAAGLPAGLLAGVRYASSSLLVPGEPNAWEAFGRWTAPPGRWGPPVGVTAELARSRPTDSWDGELMAAGDVGPVRLLAGGRAFSSFAGTGEGRWAVVAGGRVRLHRWVALAGDVAQLMGRDRPDAAWGGGLQLGIPTTPHTVSLQVTNANTATLQGASVASGDRRWGFEFTVPVTLSRYFGGGREGGGGEPVARAGSGGARGAVVEMDNRLRYLPDTLRIRVGETVTWRNSSDLLHTVTADPAVAAREASVRLPAGAAPFGSGDLRPGDVFTHRFTVPGEYRYFCVPHEAAGMVGTVIVEP